MQISKRQLDALHKKVADAKRTAVAAKDTLRCESGRVYQEHDTETRRLRALMARAPGPAVQTGLFEEGNA